MDTIRHFIGYEMATYAGVARAHCGRVVPVASHANEPTCVDCRLIKAKDDEQTVESAFGTDAPGSPVHHKPFNPTAGYSPKGAR